MGYICARQRCSSGARIEYFVQIHQITFLLYGTKHTKITFKKIIESVSGCTAGAIKYLIPNMEIIFLMNSSSMEYRLQVVRMSIIT